MENEKLLSGRLNGKRILIIGSEGGIGKACVEILVKKGAVVVASDLKEQGGSRAAFYEPCDVTDSHSVDKMFQEVERKLGGLDGFVYSSGLGSSMGFHETTLFHFDRIMAVNLRGAFYTSQKAVQLMGQGGSIVLIASQKGLCGSTGSLAYNASKGGMVIMGRSMALELGAMNIRVNCICPGATETPMFYTDMSNQPDPVAARKKVAASNPLNQITKPEQIATGVAYVLSDAAAFMTGTELVIDGGHIAGVRNL